MNQLESAADFMMGGAAQTPRGKRSENARSLLIAEAALLRGEPLPVFYTLKDARNCQEKQRSFVFSTQQLSLKENGNDLSAELMVRLDKRKVFRKHPSICREFFDRK